MQGLAIDGRIVRRSLLPAPREDADPLECPCPYGGLMGFALVAWLLVGHLCPERRPERLRSPFDERVPEELWTLETPVHPGLRATPFGHRRTPGIFLEVGGAGIALALFAASDEQPRGEDGTRSWEGLEQGEIGMALRALRDGGVKIGEGLQGAPELGHEGLNQERMGRHDACIGGEGGSRLASLETRCDDLGIAHVMRTEEGCEGGTAGELDRFEGGPATQEVAEDRRIFLLQPVQHVREIVLEGTRQAVGDPDCVTDHAAAGCDELGEGAHRGALWIERLQLVALGEQQCELERGVRGVVFGSAGREGFAIPRQRQGMDRAEDQKVIRAQGRAQGALVECETEGYGLAVAPHAQRGAPRVDGLGGVLALAVVTFCGASHLAAPIMFGISPVDPNKGRKGFV